MKHLSRTVVVLLALSLLFPLAPPTSAHAAEAVSDGGEGALLAATWRAEGPAVRSGDVTVAAQRPSEGMLALDVSFDQWPRWAVVALDVDDSRTTGMHGSTAPFVRHVAFVARLPDAPGPVFLQQAPYGESAAHAAHAAHGAPSGRAAAGVLGELVVADARASAEVVDTGGGRLALHLVLPEDVARLRPSELRPLAVFGGDLALPIVAADPKALASQEGSFRLYTAAAGEPSAATLAALAAVERPAQPLLGLVAATLIASALAYGVAVAPRAPPVATVPSARRRPGARAGRALALAALMLGSVPAASASTLGDPISPADFGPPIHEAPPARDPCAEGARERHYNVSAIDLDIVYNRWGDHDPEGQMYVLDENIAAVRDERDRSNRSVKEGGFPLGTEDTLITPLALRASLGECLVIRFTNRLDPDGPPGEIKELDHVEEPHTERPRHAAERVPESALPLGGSAERRASIHVHGLPVDPLADGAGAVGRNHDSTVAPGESRVYRYSAAYEGVFFFHDHGDWTSGGRNAFGNLEDKFRGSNTHGLFGAVIVEPAGATWTDPRTGKPLSSGWRADVHVVGQPSFREFVIFYHDPMLVGADDGPIDEPMADHGFNYRVETLSHRIFDDKDRCPSDAKSKNRGIDPCQDISMVYSSNVHGDPNTPIARAYVGDQVKFRLVHGGSEETHVHHLHGHRWRAVDGDADSARVDSQSIAPGETWTQTLEAGAGGEHQARIPGDYIYHCHLFPHLYGGMWGIFRVHDRLEPDLKPLLTRAPPPEPTDAQPGFPEVMKRQEPGHRNWRPPQEIGLDPRTNWTTTAVGAPYADPCPAEAPVRRYSLAAIATRVKLNDHGDHDPDGRIYVFAEDADEVLAGRHVPDPVVLRVREGECLEVTLLNRLPLKTSGPGHIQGDGKVSIHPHLLEFDVQGTDGSAVGWNFDTTLWPGETITYRYFADAELQTVVWHDHANGLESAFHGIYGATLVEPALAEWRNPVTGGPIYTQGLNETGAYDSLRDPVSGNWSQPWRADIIGPGFTDYREFFASIQDHIPARRADGSDYRPQLCPICFDDFGIMGFNYRSEPLWHRVHAGAGSVYDSRVHGDPATNLWEAYAGDRVVVRFHQVAYEEQHTLVVDGHRWRKGHQDSSSSTTNVIALGVSEAFNAHLECGAGGCARQSGDYLYRGGSVDDTWPGAWGIFRVHGERQPNLLPLPDADAVVPPPLSVCPRGAPERWFDVVALDRELLYNAYGDHDPNGLVYVLSHEVDALERGSLRPQPLAIRAEIGDCVKVRLENRILPGRIPLAHAVPQPTGGWVAPFTGHNVSVRELLSVRPYEPSDNVGFHAHLLTHDPKKSYGSRVGYNPDTTVGHGDSRVYTFYIDMPAGTVAPIEDLGDPLTNRRHGLFGAIIVVPSGHHATDPVTGLTVTNMAIADVRTTRGEAWRDAVLFAQNGIPLVNSIGRPVSLPGNGQVTAKDAGEAVLWALEDVTPGARHRAVVKAVRTEWPGYSVEGTLEGYAFRGIVDLEGVVRDVQLLPGNVSRQPTPSFSLTDSAGRPIADLGVTLERRGDDESSMTDATGVASFRSPLVPETISRFRFGGGYAIPVRSDATGALRLEVRADKTQFGDAVEAAALALAYVRDKALAIAPPGVSAVDVTGDVWRVRVEDPLRVYEIAIDPDQAQVTMFLLQARAVASGAPAYLPQGDVERGAARFFERHFSGAEMGPLVRATLDRFGAWRLEHHSADGIATSFRVDGQTGRVLGMLRAPASNMTGAMPNPDGELGVRILLENAADPKGEIVLLFERGMLVDEVPVGPGGRVVLDPEGAALGQLKLEVPTLDLSFPIESRRDHHVHVDLLGVKSTAAVSPAAAVAHAARALGALTPLDPRVGGGGYTPAYAVTGLLLGADGTWHVALALQKMRLELHIDAATGEFRRATLVPWATPDDECSSQLLEHMGPHPAPACANGFGREDEEDQGAKGYNYRSEPFTNRLAAVPDPSLVFSSRAHREPATPIIRAYPDDPVRIHLVGAYDAARFSGFSVGGHAWRQTRDPTSPVRAALGDVGGWSASTLELIGGAGAGTGLDGDYLYHGASQRLQVELGEWGILRVHGNRTTELRSLHDPVKVPSGPPLSDGSCLPRDGVQMPWKEVRMVLREFDGGPALVPDDSRPLTVSAGGRGLVRIILVDDKGLPLDVHALTLVSNVPWASASAIGTNGLCLEVAPPPTAAGSRTYHEVVADVHGGRVTSGVAVAVSGSGADGSAGAGGTGGGSGGPGGGAAPGATPDGGAEEKRGIPGGIASDVLLALSAAAAALALLGGRRPPRRRTHARRPQAVGRSQGVAR